MLIFLSDIKKKILEWIGHVVRMEGSRRGRPRLRWLEDVEKNLRQMKVKKWRQKAVDTEEWPFVIKEGQAHRGP